MKRIVLLAVLAAIGVAAIAGSAVGSESKPAHTHAMHSASLTAVDLKVTLTKQLGEHALLAIQATQRGYSGGKDFPALAKALDANSVALSKSITAVFGPNAGNQFLNGKLLWRDHIRFFVDYTVAKAKKNAAGQKKAVANLMGYTAAFSNFLAGATGLPAQALRAGILEHVLQLKGQLDAYASGNYAKSFSLTREAYDHMVMTGILLSDAIAKKFPNKFK